MKYRLPEAGDEAALRAYLREHWERGEEEVSSSFGLADSDYGEWLARMRRNATEGDGEWGRSLLYLCFDGERLVGLLCVRWELPRALSERYGDVGYGVRPSERRKGYATRMLREALRVCKERGRARVIVGCYADNAASEAVIRKNGGALFAQSDSFQPGRLSRYYEIEL